MAAATVDASHVETLKQALASDDDSVRYNAALDLLKVGDLAGVAVLIEAFKHESGALRLFHTSGALAASGPAAVPALVAALDSDHDQVRVDAAYTLYRIDNARLPALLPVAIAALDGESTEAARDALFFLGEIGAAARETVPALITALHGTHEPEDPRAWSLDRRVLVAALLATIGEPAREIIAALQTALDSPAPAVRWVAALALGTFGRGSRAAIPALAAMVRDEREVETVRVEAAYALAATGNPVTEVVPVLMEALRSADWWVRAFAARILGEVAAPREHGPHNPNFGWIDNFFAGQRRLQRLDDAGVVVPALADALADPDYNVRRNVCLALAELGPRAGRAIAALVEGLGRDDTGPVAAEALARIGEAAVPVLAQSLSTAGQGARRLAGYALRLIGTPAAMEAAASADSDGTFTPLPQHFYNQVPWVLDDAKAEAFELLYRATMARGSGTVVEYALPYPKHEFLRYLVEQKGMLLHGSSWQDLEVLKPLRTSVDGADSGNVSGVYADKDAIRPIYFAVVHRQRCFGLNNGFFDLLPDGEISFAGEGRADNRFYRLAVGVNGLRRDPWRPGMIYVLAPDSFSFWNEWTSRVPVPAALKVAVMPEDLPLKEQLCGADWRQAEGLWVDPREPFPFLKDVLGTPIRPAGPPWRASPGLNLIGG